MDTDKRVSPLMQAIAEGKIKMHVDEVKVQSKTSSRDKAKEAYPELARGLGRRETFDDLPASAQNAYEKFVNNIIALHRGEE